MVINYDFYLRRRWNTLTILKTYRSFSASIFDRFSRFRSPRRDCLLRCQSRNGRRPSSVARGKRNNPLRGLLRSFPFVTTINQSFPRIPRCGLMLIGSRSGSQRQSNNLATSRLTYCVPPVCIDTRYRIVHAVPLIEQLNLRVGPCWIITGTLLHWSP